MKALLYGAAATALALGALPASAHWHDEGCPGADAFAGTAAGYVSGATGNTEWWKTSSNGVMTITVHATHPDFHVRVLRNCGTEVCDSSAQADSPVKVCPVVATGTLSIEVSGWRPTYYMITAAPPVKVPDVADPIGSECSDGLDNDFDGAVDYPADGECDAEWESETESLPGQPCRVVNGADVCVEVTPGPKIDDVVVARPEQVPGGTHRVLATLDVYDVPLPGGSSVRVPCVVPTVDSTTVNACAAVPGATFIRRDGVLLDRTESEPPTVREGTAALATVSLCSAFVTITVEDFGPRNVPGASLC